MLNVYPNEYLGRHLSHRWLKCHFFITITKVVRSNKMIEMYLKIFITKILFFIYITPFFYKIGGRHSTTEAPNIIITYMLTLDKHLNGNFF